jgi:hypothetical protein
VRHVTFAHSDREVVVNPALLACLRHHFSIELPHLPDEEEVTVEVLWRWLATIPPICAERPGWSTSHAGVIGMFDCGAIAADCDPENWNGKLGRSKTLTRVFLGTGGLQSAALPKEFLPRTLVREADGSQVRVIDLAAQGSSLVVHGPPGSGKSETIVNLIAQALATKKSVLFVAQKPEAAKVVHRRLREVGLDPFCTLLMPVGTNAGLKQAVIDGLTSRTLLTATSADADEQRRARLDQSVQVLEAHAEALRFVVPQFGRTARELVAELAILHDGQIERFPATDLVEPDSPSAFARALRTLEHLLALRAEIPSEAVAALGDIGSYADTSDSNAAAAEFRSAVTRLADLVQAAECEVQALREVGVSRTAETLSGMAAWCAAAPDLGLCSDASSIRQCLRMHRPGGREAFERLRAAKATMREITTTCPEARRLATRLVESRPDEWNAACRLLDANEVARRPVSDAAGLASNFEQVRRALRAELDSNASSLAADLLRVAPSYAVWRARIALLGQCVHGLTHLRVLCACVGSGTPTPSHLTGVCAELKERDAAAALAGTYFVIDRLPDLVRLQYMRGSFAARGSPAARAWGALSSAEYRQCRRQFRAVVAVPTPTAKAHDLLTIAIRLRTCERSAHESCARWAIPEATTNIADLERATTWLESVTATAERAAVPIESLWCLMRALVDDTVGHAMQRLGGVCSKLSQHGALLHMIGEIANRGAIKADALFIHLDAAVRVLRLVDRQASAWELPYEMPGVRVVEMGRAAAHVRAIEDSCNSDADLRDLLTDSFAGIDTPMEKLERVADWHRSITESPHADWKRSISVILADPETAAVKLATTHASTTRLSGVIAEAVRICNALHASFIVTGGSAATLPDSADTVSDLRVKLAAIHAHLGAVPKLLVHHAAAKRARAIVGAGLIGRYLSGSVNVLRIQQSYRASVYRHALGRHALLAPLRNFDRVEIERSLSELRSLDEQLRRSNAAILRAALARAQVPPGVSIARVRDKTEMALISHLVGTPRARLNLHDLYARAGNAMRAFQPCTIATPTTVSEYLRREVGTFDLVIIDEASQVEPASAVGALARARQAIIVGDPKQLPPTSFFASTRRVVGTDRDDDEGLDDDVDAESILDRAIGALDSVHLRGHYRSRHHSLIDFSNRTFYESALVVPPSTGPRTDTLGVVAHFVEGATYSDGVNDREAEVVARRTLEHLKRAPDESLGIVAFNVRQAERIEEHLESLARRSQEDWEAYSRADQAPMPLFVRSLESVQGDERDVIFISYTYGPDAATAKVYQRFGPVLREGGGRRLNVLVTRARNRVEVFHSLLPEQIVGDSEGARVMRDYLNHARQAPHHDLSRGVYESEFERQVAMFIEQTDPRLTVVPQVGCVGFRIDLGIALASSPNAFLLGIECDGVTYHSEPSARQRDLIRQAILEHHGWKLHRIWSSAWWHNPEDERTRLRLAVERVLPKN